MDDIEMNNMTMSRRRFLLSNIALLVFGADTSIASTSTEKYDTMLTELGLTESLFSVLGDTIIPATSTPSASSVAADLFACAVVIEARGESTNRRFFEGAKALMVQIENRFEQQFNHVAEQRRLAFIRMVLKRGDTDPACWFLARFRELILIGWALSHDVAHSAFKYQQHIYQYDPSSTDDRITMQSHLDRLYTRI